MRIAPARPDRRGSSRRPASSAALLRPAGGAGRRRTTGRPAGRRRPRTSTRSIRTARRSSSATRPSASPTTCSSTSARTPSRRRASPSRGSASADGKSWTFKIREGMQWSDGEPATAQDACFSFQIDLDAIADPRTSFIGLGYIDPCARGRRRHRRSSARTTTTMIVDHDATRPTAILQTYVPILPKHIWGEMTYADDRRARRSTRRSSAPARTRSSSGQTGEFARFVRNPELLGRRRARPTRSSSSSSRAPTRWSRRSRPASIDYARGVNADQFDALADRAGHHDRRRARRTAGPSSAFNTYGTGTGNDDRGRRPVDAGPARPGVPRRARLRDRQAELLVERVLGGYGDVGTTNVPPVLDGLAHRARPTPRTFDLDARQPEARRRRLRHSTATASRLDKEGNADQPPAGHARLRRHLPESPSSSRTGSRSSGSRVDYQVSTSDALDDLMLPPEAGGDATRPTTTCSSGAGPGARTRTPCSRSSAATRSAARPTASTATRSTTQLYDEQNCADGRRRAQGRPRPRCRTCSTTRRRTTSCTTTPTCDAYRTDRFAGWQNQPPRTATPLFAYGILGYTLLTPAAAAIAVAVGRRGAVRRRRAARAAPTPAPVRRRAAATRGRRTARRSSSVRRASSPSSSGRARPGPAPGVGRRRGRVARGRPTVDDLAPGGRRPAAPRPDAGGLSRGRATSAGGSSRRS